MEMFTIMEFVDFFVSFEADGTWKLKEKELVTQTQKLRVVKDGDTWIKLRIIPKVAGRGMTADMYISPANTEKGYIESLSVSFIGNQPEEVSIAAAMSLGSTRLAAGVIDYLMNYDKFMSLSVEEKVAAFTKRRETGDWSILINVMFNEIKLGHISIPDVPTTHWRGNTYLNMFCVPVKIGYKARKYTHVPRYFAQAARTFAECEREGALYYSYIATCWDYPENMKAYEDNYAPIKYIESRGVACKVCGEENNKDKMYNGTCDKCLGVKKESLTIFDYHTRAENILKFKNGTKPPPKLQNGVVYLGLELEYESLDIDTSVLEVMRILENHAILKHDGSLRDGFEIVTCPATREIHSQIFESFFDKFKAKQLYLTGRSNCGFHVHISKDPLTQLTIGKLNSFMNYKDNAEFLKIIAERSSMYSKQDFNRDHVCFAWNSRGHLDSLERYNILNLKNKKTLEFRMFAPPETYESFQKDLDFVEAIVEYCLPCNHFGSLEMHKHHDQFITFLKENRKSYPYLYSFLRGFLPEKFPKPKPIFVNQELKEA